MKLDRNIAKNCGRGKYALLKLRMLDGLDEYVEPKVRHAIDVLDSAGILDWGTAGTDAEFFLIRLKDKFSTPALKAYAAAAEDFDFEYASEVREMALRSGKYSEFCKKPD